jgi:hypothetical protein
MDTLATLIPAVDVSTADGRALVVDEVDASQLRDRHQVRLVVGRAGDPRRWVLSFQGSPDDAAMDGDPVARQALAVVVAVNVVEWLDTRSNPCIVGARPVDG